MHYDTISDHDKLLLARDALRGREADHFRLSLLEEPNRDFRLGQLELEINRLREEVAKLESIVEDEIPVTDPDSPVPVEDLTPQQKAARTRKENAAKEEKEDGS
jgi:hypothetical protein